LKLFKVKLIQVKNWDIQGLVLDANRIGSRESKSKNLKRIARVSLLASKGWIKTWSMASYSGSSAF